MSEDDDEELAGLLAEIAQDKKDCEQDGEEYTVLLSGKLKKTTLMTGAEWRELCPVPVSDIDDFDPGEGGE